MPMRLVLAAVLTSAITLLASAASAAPARSPIYSFCDGRITEIPSVQPCSDGSLRIVG